jgi:uncharacterized membrane protein YpjA
MEEAPTPVRASSEEIVGPLVVVVTVIIASTWASVSSASMASDRTLHLGGEYRCIAESIVAGRGFSDPFGIPTGPTAWMPPVFPALMAAVLKAFGSIEAVAVAVVMLQNLVLVYMGLIVIRFASGPNSPRGSRIVVLAAYMVVISFNYYFYFQFTHDHVAVGLWICVFVDLADRFWGRSPRPDAIALWGLVGGLSALTAPVLGPVWAALTMMLAFAAKRIRWITASGLIAFAIVVPWMIRNAMVFHRLVPIKSNLAFELYQSQCLEKDGVLRYVTGFSHPYLSANGIERRLYRQQGEMVYMDQKRRAFLRSVREDPSGYMRRVGNRLLHATVFYVPYFHDEGAVDVARRLIHPLPFAGLLLTLTFPGWSRDKRKIACVAIYSTYLLPYVLVSYYIRYVVPIDIVKILFCLWGWQAVFLWFTAWRGPGPTGCESRTRIESGGSSIGSTATPS